MSTSLYKTPQGERAVMAAYNAALNNWPVPHDTCLIPTRHGETFVIASGETHQPAMLLLHGAGGNSSMWTQDVKAYSEHFRVYAVDLIGEAGKSAPNRPAWEGPAFTEWLDDVLTALDLERATLVGISQGAWTALKFAVVNPQRVDSLVIMAPGGIVPDRLSFIGRAIVWRMMGRWGLTRMVRALFGDQSVPDVVIANVVQTMSEFKPRLGLLPRFTDEELERLTMPVLLVGGTKDVMRDMAQIEGRLRPLVPTLHVTLLPGGGHALIGTQDAVMGFLRPSH